MRYHLLLVLLLVETCHGDTYLHNPRGSNNRLNERNAVRRNANRLFDSQNNNRGGYNVGVTTENSNGGNAAEQYNIQYYGSGGELAEESRLIVEWTNQHGCGGSEDSNPHKLNCDIVIQYMCQNDVQGNDLQNNANTGATSPRVTVMRDGTNTQTNNYQQPQRNEIQGNNQGSTYNSRIQGAVNSADINKGMQESMIWYDMCRHREANGGLFTADQRLNRGSLGFTDASKTRQNPNGQRRGYECPEERDYFPYWFPTLQTQTYDTTRETTPWIDLAFLTSNTSRCDIIKAGSFNQNGISRCVYEEKGTRTYGRAITEADCNEDGGKWVTFHSYLEILEDADTEAKCNTAAAADKRNKISYMSLRSDETTKHCVVQAPVVDCSSAPWTRVNHNGNSPDSAGNASRYDAVLPHFPSGDTKRCALRLRYNISTDDYDPFNTDSNDNKDVQNGVVSPVQQNPLVDIGADGRPLRLAINTNQYGRTFQDRSHIFKVIERLPEMEGKVIHNLNVRGKRGNIVQTFPAVEYDFIPNRATVSKDDLVHIQWTGSNTHNNQPNGGDGQTGDAGEGRGGTDRSNFLEMQGEIENYPVPFENTTFWSKVESLTNPAATAKDLAVSFMSSGYYCGATANANCPGNEVLGTKAKMNNLLNNASPSFFGHVLSFKEATSVAYMCSRNNNFSNRSQKGILWVIDSAATTTKRSTNEYDFRKKKN